MFNIFSLFGLIGVGLCRLGQWTGKIFRDQIMEDNFDKRRKKCWKFIYDMEGSPASTYKEIK